MADVNYTFWNKVDKTLFLANDRDNPARAAVAELIRYTMAAQTDRDRRVSFTLAEVGCGLGLDYGDHFCRVDGLRYQGFDGSAGMVAHCCQQWPGGSFAVGTFDSLKGKLWDFTYCKAVLEHQPDFAEPLQLLLRAARVACIINWYLPPVDTGHYRQYNDAINVHYNKYNRSAVLDCVKAAHFRCEERAIAGSPNVLYYCRLA